MHARKASALLATVAATALVLSGCSAESPQPAADITAEPEYSGTLSILTKFGGEPLDAYFADIAAAYEELHPDVTVELLQETDQSVKDKIHTLTASGALPDIYFTWTGDWAANYIEAGLAADLSEVIGPDTEWGQTFGEASLEAFASDGAYYGIPLYNNGKFMGYNEEIFEEVGIEVPVTFDDLIESCEPLRNAGYEPIAFGNKDGWPALHYLQQLFAYNVPTDVLDADFSPETAVLDDPGYVTALEQFQRLVTECTDTGAGSNGVLYTTAQEAFLGGRSAMYYQEVLEFTNVPETGDALTTETFGIFQLPANEDIAGDAGIIEAAPEGYLINARSEQAALAVDFMQFATTTEHAMTLSASPFGQPSAVIGAVTEETSAAMIVEGIDQVNAASGLVPWLDTVTVPAVADAWLAGGEALVSGSATPEDVLASVRSASDGAH